MLTNNASYLSLSLFICSRLVFLVAFTFYSQVHCAIVLIKKIYKYPTLYFSTSALK